MTTFTVVTSNGTTFNVKAQTCQQALYKACDFILEYTEFSAATGETSAYSATHAKFDASLPFITMTSAGFLRRYKVNVNTNRKSINTLRHFVGMPALPKRLSLEERMRSNQK